FASSMICFACVPHGLESRRLLGSPSRTTYAHRRSWPWQFPTGTRLRGGRPSPASIQGGTPRILRLVPGAITAVQINGSVAVLTGSADVTGLGAGTNLPFTATAERGGPGTRFVLTISGLTFNEAILEGEMSF